MGKNFSSSQILERIKETYQLKNNSELARFLGVKPNTISNWYSRNSIDFDIIFSKCEDISLDWLINGSNNITAKPKSISQKEMDDLEYESFLDICSSEKDVMNIISANGYSNLLSVLIEKMGKLNQHIHNNYEDLYTSLDLASVFLKHYSLNMKFMEIYDDFKQNKINFNELKKQTKEAFLVEKELFILLREYKEIINKITDLMMKFNDEHDMIFSFPEEMYKDNSKS